MTLDTETLVTELGIHCEDPVGKDLNQIFFEHNKGQKTQGRYEYEMILAQRKLCVIRKILSGGSKWRLKLLLKPLNVHALNGAICSFV